MGILPLQDEEYLKPLFTLFYAEKLKLQLEIFDNLNSNYLQYQQKII